MEFSTKPETNTTTPASTADKMICSWKCRINLTDCNRECVSDASPCRPLPSSHAAGWDSSDAPEDCRPCRCDHLEQVRRPHDDGVHSADSRVRRRVSAAVVPAETGAGISALMSISKISGVAAVGHQFDPHDQSLPSEVATTNRSPYPFTPADRQAASDSRPRPVQAGSSETRSGSHESPADAGPRAGSLGPYAGGK